MLVHCVFVFQTHSSPNDYNFCWHFSEGIFKTSFRCRKYLNLQAASTVGLTFCMLVMCRRWGRCLKKQEAAVNVWLHSWKLKTLLRQLDCMYFLLSPMNTFTKLLDTLKTMNGLLRWQLFARYDISINLGSSVFLVQVSLFQGYWYPWEMRCKNRLSKIIVTEVKETHNMSFTFFTNFKFSVVVSFIDMMVYSSSLELFILHDWAYAWITPCFPLPSSWQPPFYFLVQ